VRSHTKHGGLGATLADDDTMGVSALYRSVTEAVVRAERLADSHEPGAKDAYLELSLLEEKIAGHIDGLSGGCGRQAGGRTGGHVGWPQARARELAERFLAGGRRRRDLSLGMNGIIFRVPPAQASFPQAQRSA